MCTGIFIKTNDNKYIFARTLEYSKKLTYKKIKTKDFIGISAKSHLYGSKTIILDGLNKYGLCVAVFNAPHISKFLKDGNMNIVDFSEFLLKNCKNVDEVLQIIPHIIIKKHLNIEIHWAITDKTGKFIVLENDKNGLLKIYKNDVNVITNSPEFPKQIENLKKYKNITPNKEPGSITNGTGCDSLRGLYSSTSRFVRAEFLLRNSKLKKNIKEGLNTAFTILNNFDIPYGTVLDREGQSEITVYTIAYDLSNIQAYLKNCEPIPL